MAENGVTVLVRVFQRSKISEDANMEVDKAQHLWPVSWRPRKNQCAALV